MVVLPKNYLKVAELTQTVERMPKFHEKMNKLIIVINLAFSLFQFGQSFLLKEVTSTGLNWFVNVSFCFSTLIFEVIDAVYQDIREVMGVVFNFKKFNERQHKNSFDYCSLKTNLHYLWEESFIHLILFEKDADRIREKVEMSQEDCQRVLLLIMG